MTLNDTNILNKEELKITSLERPFIGRENELSKLNLLLRKRIASLAVVEGRRRIGKSRLLYEFGKNHRTYIFSGLYPQDETTAQDQRDEFARQMGEQFDLPGLAAKDWGDLFTVLSRETKQGRAVIILDEISWMGSKDPNFLGKLKNAWDMQFSHNSQLILILCGSVSAWIEKNILKGSAFYGRVSLSMSLEELPLAKCGEFWDDIGSKISAYEKFKILSVTGGIPRYLEEIIPEIPAEENIKRMCFDKDGFLYNDYNDIFSVVFLKKSKIYYDIVQCLHSSHKSYQDIGNCLGMNSSGFISECLDELIKAGFIRRDYTWHISSGKKAALSNYRISDNYLRFYLNYIEPNYDQIASGAFENRTISSLPAWESIIALQFENLVLNNRASIKKILHIKPEDVIYDNPYLQKKTLKQSGCQIDYLIQARFDTLYACEIKFSKHQIQSNVIDEMQKKIKTLKLPNRFSCRPVLIHVNGVNDDILDSRYFSEIIDFSQLLERSL